MHRRVQHRKYTERECCFCRIPFSIIKTAGCRCNKININTFMRVKSWIYSSTLGVNIVSSLSATILMLKLSENIAFRVLVSTYVRRMLEQSFTEPNNILGPPTQQRVSRLGNIERLCLVSISTVGWKADALKLVILLIYTVPFPSHEQPLKRLRLFPQALGLNHFEAECGLIWGDCPSNERLNRFCRVRLFCCPSFNIW